MITVLSVSTSVPFTLHTLVLKQVLFMSFIFKISGLLSSDRCSVLWPGGFATGHLKIKKYISFNVFSHQFLLGNFKKVLLGKGFYYIFLNHKCSHMLKLAYTLKIEISLLFFLKILIICNMQSIIL